MYASINNQLACSSSKTKQCQYSTVQLRRFVCALNVTMLICGWFRCRQADMDR